METLGWLTQNLEMVILLVCLLVFGAVLYRWNCDASKFSLKDLLVDSKSGVVSLYKIGQFLALLVSTWIIIYETRAGNLTEWLFASYMFAWGGINLTKKFLENKTSTRGKGNVKI